MRVRERVWRRAGQDALLPVRLPLGGARRPVLSTHSPAFYSREGESEAFGNLPLPAKSLVLLACSYARNGSSWIESLACRNSSILWQVQIIRPTEECQGSLKAVYICRWMDPVLNLLIEPAISNFLRFNYCSSRCLSVRYSALACWLHLWCLPCLLLITSQLLAAPALPTVLRTRLLTLPLILQLILLLTLPLPPTLLPTALLQLLQLSPRPPALLPTLCRLQLL